MAGEWRSSMLMNWERLAVADPKTEFVLYDNDLYDKAMQESEDGDEQ